MSRRKKTQNFEAHHIEISKEADQYFLVFTENRCANRNYTVHVLRIKISFWQFGAIVKMIWYAVQGLEAQTKSLIEKLKGISL